MTIKKRLEKLEQSHITEKFFYVQNNHDGLFYVGDLAMTEPEYTVWCGELPEGSSVILVYRGQMPTPPNKEGSFFISIPDNGRNDQLG